MQDNTISGPKRKSELHQILKTYWNHKRRRAEFIEVIMEVRKVPKKEASNTQTVFPQEVDEIFKRFDYKK